ncbi:serine kinase/phosphatase [Ralstonia sp. 22086]|uniref:serine kinase/phosphatase n=1 Tax=Ralstonia TaxID=48736 RepID=UPI0039C6282A
MTVQTTTAALRDTGSRLSFDAQNEAITKEGEQDMLNAARLQNELNRTNMFAKLMEAGPKAAKDLIS